MTYTLTTHTILHVCEGVQLHKYRSEEIVVIDNPNRVHAFNRFEEEDHVQRYEYDFRFINVMRNNFYDMGSHALDSRTGLRLGISHDIPNGLEYYSTHLG